MKETQLLGGVGVDVGLTAFAPVDLDEVGPWGDGVSAADAMLRDWTESSVVLARWRCGSGDRRRRRVAG